MKPVFYHNKHIASPVKTPTELNTVGAIITILDFALVNGDNQLNIVSITRVGTVLTLKTSSVHTFTIGDLLHVENTGEALFDGRHHVKSIPNSDEVVFEVLNTGPSSTGAVGTIKNASAGWTKVHSEFNGAVYRTGLLSDGSYRYVQVRDNGAVGATYEFGVRVAKNQTDFDVAEIISPERYFYKYGSTGKWAIIADDKGFYLNFENIQNFYVGYISPFSVGDTIPFFITMGTVGSTYSSSFGAHSSAPVNQTNSNTVGTFLESYNGFATNQLAAISKLGSISRGIDSLSTYQDVCRPVNPLDGSLLMAPVDAWEKVADTGQTHAIRGRVPGLYQPYGKIPSNLIIENGFFKFIAKNLNGKDRNMVMLTVDGITSAQLAFDITGDW